MSDAAAPAAQPASVRPDTAAQGFGGQASDQSAPAREPGPRTEPMDSDVSFGARDTQEEAPGPNQPPSVSAILLPLRNYQSFVGPGSWWSRRTGEIREMYILDSRQPFLKINVPGVDMGDGTTIWQVNLAGLIKYRGPTVALCWDDGTDWYENLYGRKTPIIQSGPIKTPTKPPAAKVRSLDDLLADDSLQTLAQSFIDQDTVRASSDDEIDLRKTARRMRRRDPEKPFSMMEAFNDHHDLLRLLVACLDIPTLISLYSIDKRFHFMFNCNYVAYITSSMRTWAPGSDMIFPWRSYKRLCIADPMDRITSRWQGKEHLAKEKYEARRNVPGLKWLQMVCYREAITKDILIQLALENLRCLPHTSDAIKRMWYMLDVPLNMMRIALIHSETYFTNETLEKLTCFFLKLDMFFTDATGRILPPHANTRLYPTQMATRAPLGSELREYMLHERQLTVLWRVLRGWSPDPNQPQLPLNRLDIVRLWVRHKYRPPASFTEDIKRMSVLGVPWWELGTQRLERSYVPKTQYQPKTMLRPDELVMLEGIRRRLQMHRRWVYLASYGLRDALGQPFPDLNEEEMNRRLLTRKVGS